MSWCVHCNVEHAVAPTRLCAGCLAEAIEENARDGAEVLVCVDSIVVVEPDPYDIHIEIMRAAYPADLIYGGSTVRH